MAVPLKMLGAVGGVLHKVALRRVMDDEAERERREGFCSLFCVRRGVPIGRQNRRAGKAPSLRQFPALLPAGTEWFRGWAGGGMFCCRCARSARSRSRTKRAFSGCCARPICCAFLHDFAVIQKGRRDNFWALRTPILLRLLG